jgi:hypothetical protein
MKYALVENTTVYDVVDQKFEVTPNFTWVECPDEVQAHLWTYNGQSFTAIPQEETEAPNQPISQGSQTL